MTLPALPPNPRFVIPIVAGIGNALLAVPMVRQIKTRFAGSHITILARISAMAEPFRRLPEVDEVLVTGKGAKGALRNILWARRAHADVYLVPFPSNRWQYSMLALTSGAKLKLLHGYPVGKWRAMGFVGTRVPAERGLHDVVQNLRLLKFLGATIDESEAPKFPVNDGDRARATKLLEELGLTSRTPFIAIHAGSANTVLAQAKRWGASKSAELMRSLRNDFPHEILLLEGPDESGVAEEIASAVAHQSPGIAIPGLSVLKLTSGLGDVAAILERAALYAGTDSGLAHLAAAVGTRAVTIFAPADPERVCPFGNRDLVCKPDKPCSPCFMYPWETPYPKMKCSPPFCIEEVTVGQVMGKVREVLPLVPSPSKERVRVRVLPMAETVRTGEPPHPGPLPEGEGEMRNRSEERASDLRKLLFKIIKYAVCVAAIVFVGIALAKNLKDFDWRNLHPHWGFVFAAAGCIGLVTLTQIAAYRLLLAAYGPKLTWPQAATLSWVPGLAKYIPGKVVAIGSTVYLLRRYHVPAAIALSVTLMGDAVAVLTGLITGAPLLLSPEAQAKLPGGWAWCALIIAGCLVSLYPPIFTKLVNIALRKLKRSELSAIPKLQYYFLPILAGFAQWICWGAALWCVARSIADISVDQLPRFIVIAAMANTVAYLAFFAPAGLGFREPVLILGLDPLIGLAQAAIVVIAIRVIQTLVEILLAIAGWFILRKMERLDQDTK